MNRRKPSLVAVAGSEFDRVYAGTQYLLEELNRTFAVELYVYADLRRRDWYRRLPFPCRVVSYRDGTWRGWHIRAMSRVFALVVRLRLLFARRVLITETPRLREAAWAKRLRGKRMVLAQFCQELILPEEYPQEYWPRIQKRLARVPDIVIDVDPFRARVRAEYFRLNRAPYVLRNTIPLALMPPPAPRGRLWELAGIAPPPAGVPVLVHAGGVGREKPFERVIDAVAGLDRPVFLLAFCAAAPEKIRQLRELAARKLKPGRFCIGPAVSREQLQASLWEADIGVVDYTYSVEPTANQKYCAPTKLYEFMACGLAILGSNNESLRDVIEREGIGCCAAADRPEDLTAALGRLLARDIGLLKTRARESFAAKYCYEQACRAEVARLAAALLAGGRPPAP